MRIAIISDIHSNFEALTKALEIIDQRMVDEIICLGDIVGYGANPNECIELVRARCTSVVKGNHDEAVLHIDITQHFTENARKAIIWTSQQLTDESYEFLRSLPFALQKNNLYFVHASPCNPSEWHYILTEEEAENTFHCFSESLCLIGHTHIPAIYSPRGRLYRIAAGERCLINVGSIGQPRDGNSSLSFGLLDTKAWMYENIRSPYDVETAMWKIIKADLPAHLAHRLLRGR
jgi:putative phosphoesterase